MAAIIGTIIGDTTGAVLTLVSGAIPVVINPGTGLGTGANAYSYIAAASANQDQQTVKAIPATLYSVQASNLAAALRYLKIYNKALPTSADTPVFRCMLPASATAPTPFIIPIPGFGVAFATALGFRITTGEADNDANAATAGDVVVNLVFL